jgi:ABC-type glycerol-3-phosphate transport system substrate-binding protein
MKTRLLRIASFSLILLLVGCSPLAPYLSTPTSAPAAEATATPQTSPTSTAPTVTTRQPGILRVWLPPLFDPNAETSAAALLSQRLQQFEDDYPGITLDIRIKSEADILNALSVTSKAAPDAMPDLIALSYSDMQRVAAAGFLHPLEGLTSVLQEPDWYAFARDLGHVKNTEYGIPFASDALLTVYRPAVFEELPSTWEGVFESGAFLVFPVSDPNALLSLSLYLSENKQLVDEQGAITLDEQSLTRLLSFYKQAIDTESIPPATREYQTDAQSLQFFRDGKADLAVVRASSDIQTQSGSYIPLLGLDNSHYSLGDGWVWTLAGSNAENQPLAVELATYLVESNFMSEWTHELGYLPTRPQALDGWEGDTLKTSIDEVLQSTHPMPPDDVVAIVGPILQGALVRIFNGEQPEVVARSVIEDLK